MSWQKLLILILHGYKIFISPLFKTVGFAQCRRSPTCSEYSILAIKKHGVARGVVLAVKQLINCQPYGRYF